MTATEHSNLFCVYKNIIVCKVPVMKQHNRYSDTGKNATIIRVVNGLALSMVTVFEDIFLYFFTRCSLLFGGSDDFKISRN